MTKAAGPYGPELSLVWGWPGRCWSASMCRAAPAAAGRWPPFPALILTAALIAFLLDIPKPLAHGVAGPRLLALALVPAWGGCGAVSLVLCRACRPAGDLLKALPRGAGAESTRVELLLNEARAGDGPMVCRPTSAISAVELCSPAPPSSGQPAQPRLLSLLGATLTLGRSTRWLCIRAGACSCLIGCESDQPWGSGRWCRPCWRAMVLGTLYRTFPRPIFAGQVVLGLRFPQRCPDMWSSPCWPSPTACSSPWRSGSPP